CILCGLCFFFQAEDGIRDGHVTGVQTCALPISMRPAGCYGGGFRRRASPSWPHRLLDQRCLGSPNGHTALLADSVGDLGTSVGRSEERRVGIVMRIM